MSAAARLDAASLPIPRNIAPGPGWTDDMREMADHIGAYDVLLLSEAQGGQRFYIPADPERNPFRDIIGEAKAARFSATYAGNVLTIPKADYAIAHARRGPLIAAVRAGLTTVPQAARMLGLRRETVSRLVHRTDEGRGAAAFAPDGRTAGRKADARQLDMFASDAASVAR